MGCDYYDDRLVVNNKKAFNIYVSFSEDTILSTNGNNTFMIPDYFIKSGEKKNIIEPGNKKSWQFLAEKSLMKQLHIFILSEDTLKKYETISIVKMKKYDSRIDIGLKDLEGNNWEIICK
jgi:hypothetical protein